MFPVGLGMIHWRNNNMYRDKIIKLLLGKSQLRLYDIKSKLIELISIKS